MSKSCNNCRWHQIDTNVELHPCSECNACSNWEPTPRDTESYLRNKVKDLDAQVLIQQNWKEHYAARATELEARATEAQQVCWEAHQHIGGSLVQEMPEQDSIAIMDKLCNVINKAKEQS